MPCKCIPARLICTFLNNKRASGRPNITSCHSFLNDVKKIIPSVVVYGAFYTSGHVTLNEVRWAIYINSIGNGEPPKPSD